MAIDISPHVERLLACTICYGYVIVYVEAIKDCRAMSSVINVKCAVGVSLCPVILKLIHA